MSLSFKFRGFSLIEILVSLTIVTVILTVIVLKQSTYVDSAALSNLADEISLSLSQAQAYGIAVKELTPGSSDFSASYGLAFSLLSDGSNTNYIFFADRNNNNIYEDGWACPLGGISECLEKATISRGNYIDDICIVRTSGADQCGNARRVDINFERPETSSRLTFFNNSGQTISVQNLKGAKVVLKSSSGLSRSVVVYTTGQISVQ